MINTGASTGSSSGHVTARNRVQPLAPSTAAASYTSGGIIFKPANEASIINGQPIHSAAINNTIKVAVGLCCHGNGLCSNKLIQPLVGSKMLNHMIAPTNSGMA